MRIQLVEDDRTAQFVRRGFTQAGFAVDRAADGLEGLFMAQEVAYDAAIFDIMLQRLDALALTERLRKIHRSLCWAQKNPLMNGVLGLQTGGSGRRPSHASDRCVSL